MFIDARDIVDRATLEADLCVIGAGAAGISVALQFASTQMRVVVLEGGGLPEDGDGPGPYTVLEGSPPRLVTDRHLHWSFGGNTNNWFGNCRPLDEADFEPRDWVPYSGWPIRRRHLLPFYERAQAACGLGDVRYYDIDTCRPHLIHQPIVVHSPMLTTKVVHSCPVVSFDRLYRERFRNAGNVRVCLHANAIRLETDPRGDRVHGVEVGTAGGRRFRVSARVFVLAGGGIANPRLLLCSNDVNPSGLGNDHDLVGRYFMEHPYVDIPLGRWKRGSDLRFHHCGELIEGMIVWGQVALSEDLMRRERVGGMSLWFARAGVLSGAWAGLLKTLRPGPSTLGDPRSDAHDRASGGGARVTEILTKLARRARRMAPGGGYFLRVALEQTPDPRNRVRLSWDRDRFGQRGVDLVFELSEEHLAGHARLLRIGADALGLDGLSIAAQMHRMFHTGQMKFFWHHMGTTRMHDDPKRGVVDGDCRVHGVSNLFVAGSSVFPTGGTAPPTLTIVALALRLAEHIGRHLS